MPIDILDSLRAMKTAAIRGVLCVHRFVMALFTDGNRDLT